MDIKKQNIEQVEEELRQMKRDIETFKRKIDAVETKARKNLEQHINMLEEYQREAEAKFKAIKEDGNENWDDIKSGYEQIRKEIAESIANTALPQ